MHWPWGSSCVTAESDSCEATVDTKKFKGIRLFATATNVMLPTAVSHPGMHQDFTVEVCDLH